MSAATRLRFHFEATSVKGIHLLRRDPVAGTSSQCVAGDGSFPPSPGSRSWERLLTLLHKKGPLSMPTLCWEAHCSSESAPPVPWAPALLPPQTPWSALTAAKELGRPEPQASRSEAAGGLSPQPPPPGPRYLHSVCAVPVTSRGSWRIDKGMSEECSPLPGRKVPPQWRGPMAARRWESGPDRPPSPSGCRQSS